MEDLTEQIFTATFAYTLYVYSSFSLCPLSLIYKHLNEMLAWVIVLVQTTEMYSETFLNWTSLRRKILYKIKQQLSQCQTIINFSNEASGGKAGFNIPLNSSMPNTIKLIFFWHWSNTVFFYTAAIMATIIALQILAQK